MAGVSSNFDRVVEGAALKFSFFEINHFSNLEDKYGIDEVSVPLPVAHVPMFLGEGLSSSNSKASTS